MLHDDAFVVSEYSEGKMTNFANSRTHARTISGESETKAATDLLKKQQEIQIQKNLLLVAVGEVTSFLW